MSARNPLSIIKSRIYASRSKAYHVLGIRDMSATVDFIYSEIMTVLSPSFTVEALKAWIRDLITSKIEQTDYEQLDLWKGDYWWPIKIVQPFWHVDYVTTSGEQCHEEFDREADAHERVASAKREGAAAITLREKKLTSVKEIALADLRLPEIKQIEDRKEANIERAIHERNRFRAYAEVIKPILENNEGWTWGDAVRWLESLGPLPDLD